MSAPTRRWSWAVLVLVLASAGLLAAHFSFDGDTFQNCRYLGPSTRMYVTAWAAPACALAALIPLVLLRGAGSGREDSPWPPPVSSPSCCWPNSPPCTGCTSRTLPEGRTARG